MVDCETCNFQKNKETRPHTLLIISFGYFSKTYYVNNRRICTYIIFFSMFWPWSFPFFFFYKCRVCVRFWIEMCLCSYFPASKYDILKNEPLLGVPLSRRHAKILCWESLCNTSKYDKQHGNEADVEPAYADLVHLQQTWYEVWHQLMDKLSN